MSQAAIGVYLITVMFLVALPILANFPAERDYFLHDYEQNYYSAVAYLIAKGLVELPVLAMQTLICMGVQ